MAVKAKKKRRYYRSRKKSGSSKMVLFTFGMLLFTFIFFVAILGLKSMEKVTANAISPEDVFIEVKLATEIYDRNGERLFRLQGDQSNSDKVSISEINNIIRAAFLAAEDNQFYIHRGFDEAAIMRCAANMIAEKDTCGASTITQQVVKINTANNQPTIERKLNEIIVASRVEKEYPKDKILEMYLSVTPYGSNITGIKTAANFYFGISDLNQLSLAQAVALAAIVNNPVQLSPTVSSNNEIARQLLAERINYIFSQLEEHIELINEQLEENIPGSEQITLEMIEGAKNENITYRNPEYPNIKAGHFVNYTLEELQKRNYKNGEPFTFSELQNGGYKIFTSLDYNLQKIAEGYAWLGGEANKVWNVHNAAIITIQPSTGQILTMAGSKSFTGSSEACDGEGKNCKYNPEVNVLTSLQSPGSTNKSLAYYIGFNESKFFPGSFLPDIPIKIGSYVPKNWDGNFTGINNSARQMLRQSRNIPALEVMMSIGTDKYLQTAREFGYTTYTDDSQYGASLVLGGGDILPIEHAQAYGVFANGGDLVKVDPILRIEDRNGNIIYETNPERKRVADPAAVYLLNQTLLGLDVGTGDTIAWDNREIAGKTGTTEFNQDNFLITYSPEFVTLGWAGNNNNDSLNFLYGWPAFVVNPWLKDYMRDVTNTGYFNSKSPFFKPDNVYHGGGDCDLYGMCRGITKDWLISGREPAADSTVRWKDEKWYRTFRFPNSDIQRFIEMYMIGIRI